MPSAPHWPTTLIWPRFEFELRINDAHRQQAALKPQPEAGFSLENLLGTGAAKGFKEAEATLSLSQVIELGGKREARLATVDASRSTLRVARQAAQLDVLAEVTRRFVAVAEAQEKVKLALRATEIASETARAADTPRAGRPRPACGTGPRHGGRAARAAGTAEHAQLGWKRRSVRWPPCGARTMHRSTASRWAMYRHSCRNCPRPATSHTLVKRLEQSPDFLRFASEERLHEAELRLATTQRRADLTIGGGVRRLQVRRRFRAGRLGLHTAVRRQARR